MVEETIKQLGGIDVVISNSVGTHVPSRCDCILTESIGMDALQ